MPLKPFLDTERNGFSLTSIPRNRLEAWFLYRINPVLLWLKQSKYAQKTAYGSSEIYFSVILYKKKESFGEQELAKTPQNHLIMIFQEVFPESD